jgi:hypothetical protein
VQRRCFMTTSVVGSRRQPLLRNHAYWNSSMPSLARWTGMNFATTFPHGQESKYLMTIGDAGENVGNILFARLS